jgi:adenylylsulfate kinase-like enzyme
MKTRDLTAFKQILTKVYWIGGAPCAGKSSIAYWLGEQFGFKAIHPRYCLPDGL